MNNMKKYQHIVFASDLYDVVRIIGRLPDAYDENQSGYYIMFSEQEKNKLQKHHFIVE